MAELGTARVPFGALERCGIDAEARMLAATGGINTHRGAIFMLGLLCAAAGAAQADGLGLSTTHWRAALQQHWGPALRERCARASALPGGRAAQRYGLRSASEEAALGLPVLFECAVPAWREARSRGLSGHGLQLQVFFEIMAVLDDSNLAHRGGLDGLAFAHAEARRFLSQGGAARDDAVADAQAIHRAFVARRLSPGGCADTLSAACLLHRLGALG
jgi:triphosphoribosyl-dephospho-CoA synthase